MSTVLSSPVQHRLTGDWRIQPVSLDAEDFSIAPEWQTVPECCHLQPALFPAQPYWGDLIRVLNRSAWLYQREFSVPDLAFERARLRFDGIDYFASVWLNGQFVGAHEGSFAPFTFDISQFLHRHGNNQLMVRVSSPWDQPNPHGAYPLDHVIRGLVKGLYEHGEGVIPPDINPIGIWRPAWLLLDNGISLDHVHIRTKLHGTINLRFTVSNSGTDLWNGALSLRIDPDNHDGSGVNTALPIAISPGQQSIDVTLTVPDPRLWWPWDQGSPDLYHLTGYLQDEQGQGCGSLEQTFGIREVSLERSPERFVYRINDRPVYLRGTSYIPSVYLSECNSNLFKQDLALIRELNLNLLRVHVHVSPPELYDLCDRTGIMIWQDFELNWIHDSSLEFEARARRLQHDMIDLLGNHPSIITWTCHNEPTMVFSRRSNLEKHPDPVLYADALEQDDTRPIFLCSGQNEADWQRSGDVHSYYGAVWSSRYTDVYAHSFRLNSEFGVEAPPAIATLRTYPTAWERLKHLEPEINNLWEYQAELIQFHVEHLRRQRAEGCAGYVHFWFADLVPQVGWGVLDVYRRPKGGFAALQLASQPLLIALEHDGRQAYALWIFNDTQQSYFKCTAICRIFDRKDRVSFETCHVIDIASNRTTRIADVKWPATECHRVELILQDERGTLLCRNRYQQPFQARTRPQSYPWKFDPFLGCKVFDAPDAPSLADTSGNPLTKLIPLSWRESLVEWVLRQRLSPQVVSNIAHIVDFLNP